MNYETLILITSIFTNTLIVLLAIFHITNKLEHRITKLEVTLEHILRLNGYIKTRDEDKNE